MAYEIVRSRRKTAAIYVRPNGAVEVRVPLKYPEEKIQAFVTQKADWIEKHRRAALERAKCREAFALNFGDTLRVLDGRYPILQGERAAFDGKAFYLRADRAIKPQATALYREIAREILLKKIAFWSPSVGVQAAGLKINGAKTRWGSCSGKNSLNFSWKLVMAPEAAVDYVVVHELCHILEHNHSSRFWTQVARVLPDYSVRREVLKNFACQLAEEDWES